jgi:hypothetical protein
MGEILESVMQVAQARKNKRVIFPFLMNFWKKRLPAVSSAAWKHP